MFGLSALELARIQFAFTISFHIIFPAITIGLASFLALLEGLWLKTRNTDYKTLYHFWSKIFAVNFGMGVVSGLVMAYQFGTNWSFFSEFAGSITGPLLVYEVLTAFFLEAGFLGVMLFGWSRVGEKLHFFATCMVALGTIISTFWILASNSWMQTPQGHEIINNQIVPVDWFAVIFNPSFPYRLLHMGTAAFLASAFFIAASAAWHLLKGNDSSAMKKMLSMAMWLILIIAPLQAIIGDFHGLNTLKYQPAKVAAMEGHWENRPGEATPLILFGIPNQEAEETHYAVKIPYLASLILTHSTDKQVPALKEFAPEDRPNVFMVFWSFRVMVGLGILMIVAGVWGLLLRYKKRLYENRTFLRFIFLMAPSGLIAILAGWFTTEIGRQPWVVYGLMRTKDAVSAHGEIHMSISLLIFFIVYAAVFGVGYAYMMKLIRKGPNKELTNGH
ncbi:cytochrome ubiquinol oxidase subunit I [Xenorhabdus bovienii]|uniref:Ubiquinol oxidase subunit I, cyanide insensitive n=1 Tax=Xenorhabdus bovienii str. Intermedium TaxID=1379677 RepID=A0A077QR38_XENBV|nr:cytochrome ubiquinol oxidase subunit I [Xenorhabdus bovienii]MDE9482840.1 cytochrome ubiquinol oxidase subunit I [Xenorhabdus bovienii]MDE9553103.1 cytochrome ubiquinol oxidase subunit I [Xenorhabdus bovienii]MDE9557296.1 cytochrome ubiquinol oxidase subunit I [Xenorhabdus bovienii]MDE9566068.1 cytochrome ubiquinol oxidase subunit I [Xenorhabdus bovienii]CDH35031.1 ubiquinol oxidase subunit I, cyanide insensitive [Xenorhabdus bovienii str. Intermedium]